MKHECNGRREFLVKSTATAGGILLSLSGLASAASPDPDDYTIKLDEKSPLNQVGGSYLFDYKGDTIAVIRKSDAEFAAFSAICTHKGGKLYFDSKLQNFVCPLHRSIFDNEGQRLSGPARQPLAKFATDKAVVVSLKL